MATSEKLDMDSQTGATIGEYILGGFSIALLVESIVLQTVPLVAFQASLWALFAGLNGFVIASSGFLLRSVWFSRYTKESFSKLVTVFISIMLVSSLVSCCAVMVGFTLPLLEMIPLAITLQTTICNTVCCVILLKWALISTNSNENYTNATTDDAKDDEMESANHNTLVDEATEDIGCMRAKIVPMVSTFAWFMLTVSVVLASFDIVGLVASLFNAQSSNTFVQVDNHLVHVECKGELVPGTLPVFFEHGWGGHLLDWHYVQTALANSTRTCAYSKSGYGYSERGTYPRTIEQTVSEMEQVVNALGYNETGMVLVGHSLAGYTTRLYAKRNPEIVKGLVLVDALYSESQSTCEERFFIVDFLLASFFNFGRRYLAPSGIVRAAAYTVGLPWVFAFHMLPDDVIPEYVEHLSGTQYYETRYQERLHFEQACTSIVSLPNATIPVPFTHIIGENGIWGLGVFGDGLAEKFVSLSPKGKFVRILGEDATHSGIIMNPKFAPQVVAEIREVMESA